MKRDTLLAAALAAAMFLVYKANGREIPNYDSQPTKYAARELLLRGTLSLNYVVGRTPELGNRPAFVKANDGRIRAAYSPVPAIAAASLMWPLWKTGLIDVRAPGAPSTIAAVSAAALVSLAIACTFLTLRARLSPAQSFVVAAGLGLGTGFWPTASQTLWQHETAIFGLSLAVLGFAGPERSWQGRAVLLGAGAGLAVASRLQLAPAATVMIAGAAVLWGWRRAAVALACASVVVIPVLLANYRWFGTVLGGAARLEMLHETVHRTSGSFALGLEGFAGLLVSPNRGLLVFSPIVAVAFAGVPRALREKWQSPHRWLIAAAAAEFLLYGLYTVWWGGHTYGPRYMLDVLPLLVPAAAFGLATLRTRPRRALAVAALAWSVGVSVLGAFTYPNERWNSDPVDVDVAHDRLWNVSDSQILRAWRAAPSPQNYSLLTIEAVRVPQP